MKVYFDKNFWHQSSGGEEAPGLCVNANAGFWYGDYFWLVPAVYLFREGITADICRRIPRTEIKEFFHKWGQWEDREEELSEKQRMDLNRENPLQFEVSFKLGTEDGMLESRSGSSMVILPRDMEEKAGAAKAREMPKVKAALAYGLDREDGWQIYRHSFSWEKGNEFCENGDSREPGECGALTDFRLTLSARKECILCGLPFVTEVGCGESIQRFSHPVTEEPVEIKILGCNRCKIDLPESVMNEFRKGYDFPSQAAVLEYVLQTELADGEDFRVGDCCQSEEAIFTGFDAGEKKSAASVSIIGGSHGPTSVFLAGKRKDEEENPRAVSVCSSLHFEPVNQATWQAKIWKTFFKPETFVLTADIAGA